MFSVHVLVFGDHADLARRCLSSISKTIDTTYVNEVRIGMNAVCGETRDVVLKTAQTLPVTCRVFQEEKGRNVEKYPLMRRMLQMERSASEADSVMWFDDDSYIMGDNDWWGLVDAAFNAASTRITGFPQKYQLMGSVYRLPKGFRGSQFKGIAVQPWYDRVPIIRGHIPKFVTGGWWVARREILDKWDYPFKEIHHNGGDSILGELCRQQGYQIEHFNTGVAINYDISRGGESRARRRGLSSRWPWEDYKIGVAEDLSHHDFDVKVLTFTKASREGGKLGLGKPPPLPGKLPGSSHGI